MRDLARAAEVSPPTVASFERGDPVRATTVEAIQRAPENAGVIFIDADDGGPGAQLRKGERSGEGAIMGRPPIGKRPMTNLERQHRYRARLKAVRAKLAAALTRLAIPELEEIRESAGGGKSWKQVLDVV
jgi:hypothetical protein